MTGGWHFLRAWQLKGLNIKPWRNSGYLASSLNHPNKSLTVSRSCATGLERCSPPVPVTVPVAALVGKPTQSVHPDQSASLNGYRV